MRTARAGSPVRAVHPSRIAVIADFASLAAREARSTNGSPDLRAEARHACP